MAIHRSQGPAKLRLGSRAGSQFRVQSLTGLAFNPQPETLIEAARLPAIGPLVRQLCGLSSGGFED